jgi:tellurite resistance protein
MAAAALVSTADDDIRLSEQLALDDALSRIDKLDVFAPNVAVDLHREFADRIRSSAAAGRARALEVIDAFDGDRDDRLLVLYVAAVVARGDLELSSAEEAVLARICEGLRLPVAESLDQIWGAVASRPSGT